MKDFDCLSPSTEKSNDRLTRSITEVQLFKLQKSLFSKGIFHAVKNSVTSGEVFRNILIFATKFN